jgi:hypothetical protein
VRLIPCGSAQRREWGHRLNSSARQEGRAVELTDHERRVLEELEADLARDGIGIGVVPDAAPVPRRSAPAGALALVHVACCLVIAAVLLYLSWTPSVTAQVARRTGYEATAVARAFTVAACTAAAVSGLALQRRRRQP